MAGGAWAWMLALDVHALYLPPVVVLVIACLACIACNMDVRLHQRKDAPTTRMLKGTARYTRVESVVDHDLAPSCSPPLQGCV
jgi:hypothetical protein